MVVTCANYACMLDAACLCFRGAAVPAHKHPDQAEPDSHFEWITPDESSHLEFTRDRAAVLQMASEWDLCISGDGLTHLQQTGQEAAFIPLAQVLLNLCYYATVCNSVAAAPNSTCEVPHIKQCSDRQAARRHAWQSINAQPCPCQQLQVPQCL